MLVSTASPLTGSAEHEQMRLYVSSLIVDLLAVRIELRREQERMRVEADRLRDLLDRARSRLSPRRMDEELEALLGEIEDALERRML